ncbi:MAG TPA: hypothetical protein VKP88_01180 [Candidatus Paceibacterota bacterium]|nr:hypothetical protein [Candidatus Paceibacterota bacterium]
MLYDLDTLPKTTPVAARNMLAEATSELADLRAELNALRQTASNEQADRAIAAAGEHTVDDSVFDRVNRRANEYGTVLNCRIAESCERLNVSIAAKALGTTLAARHSVVRKDRNGRKWIDFYPAVNAAKSEDILQPAPQAPAAPAAPTVDVTDDCPF